MSSKDTILQALSKISDISNSSGIEFGKKLHQILGIVLKYLNSEKGSIMILKGRSRLQILASSNPELIGITQSLKEDSPSSWVVKHKKPLFNDTDDTTELRLIPDRYRKDAFMIAPIISNNKVLGVLSITEKIGPDRFSNEEREVFLNLAGHIIGALQIHRLAESLRKNRRSLKKKNEQLKRLEQLRTEMFNMLIHDLKGPISEIVANLDILSYVSDKKNMDFVESAQSGCDALHRMISNLLDIARLEDGSLQLILEKLEPDLLIEEALSGMHSFAGIKKIPFKKIFSHLPPTQRFFLGDRRILLRVLQNLLVNAIRYSPVGKPVEAGFDVADSDHFEFFVKDSGPGIPPEFKAAIFNKYFQISARHDSRHYSTGLGLTFCKMAVEAHGGKIFVESDGKKGSCFKFILPSGIEEIT